MCERSPVYTREDTDMAKGLLLAAINFRNVAEDEFQDWYDTEHLPERGRVAGFLTAQRWIGVDDAKMSVAIYDLETVGVLASPGYTAIGGQNLSPWSKRITAKSERLLRFEGEQTLPGDQVAPANAGALLLNAMNVVPEAEDDFNTWYDEEHIPALAAVPGTLCAWRFRATQGPLSWWAGGAGPVRGGRPGIRDPECIFASRWKGAREDHCLRSPAMPISRENMARHCLPGYTHGPRVPWRELPPKGRGMQKHGLH